jgi:hypothetical protein
MTRRVRVAMALILGVTMTHRIHLRHLRLASVFDQSWTQAALGHR